MDEEGVDDIVSIDDRWDALFMFELSAVESE